MNGSEKMRMNSNGQLCIGYSGANATGANSLIVAGNVGIGTTSPSYKLDINGVTRFQDIVRLKNDAWNLSDDGKNRLYFGGNDRTYFGSFNGYEWRNAADGALAVITNAGNVGIGTTSPTVKLHVSGGGIRIQGSGDPNNSLRFDDTGGTSRNAMFVSSSNYLVVGNTNYTGLQLIHTGSAPSETNGNGITTYYGIDERYYLSEPNKWLAVRINSVNYVMPMYQV
jgi:hypothetical protein